MPIFPPPSHTRRSPDLSAKYTNYQFLLSALRISAFPNIDAAEFPAHTRATISKPFYANTSNSSETMAGRMGGRRIRCQAWQEKAATTVFHVHDERQAPESSLRNLPPNSPE